MPARPWLGPSQPTGSSAPAHPAVDLGTTPIKPDDQPAPYQPANNPSDSDYSNELVLERYQHDLRGQLGNLLYRITRSTAWDFTAAIELSRNIWPEKISDTPFFSPEKETARSITCHVADGGGFMDNLNLPATWQRSIATWLMGNCRD